MTQPSAVPVTLAEIARIAGVGRAAVSNWRRRHDTFPTRIGGSDASPQFSLAEVESWLRGQGKLREVGGRERLWPQFDVLGDRVESGLAIALSALRQPRDVTVVTAPTAELSLPARELVRQADALAEEEGAQETFDFLLGRWLDANVRQISATPAPMAELMAAIANQVIGRDAGGSRIILDPACGTGGLLQAAAEAGSLDDVGATPVILAGVDQEPVLAALATARLSFVRSGSAERGESVERVVDVRAGDSLRADPHAGLQADIVLCNPPFNERDWGYEELATDPRWTYGLPPRTEPELAWIQHALSKLTPGGVAVLVLPPAVASRRAGRRIRGALLRAGVLRSVIALPPGCAPPHSVSLHLWVLRASGVAHTLDAGRSLQLVDAGGVGAAVAKVGQGIDWAVLHRAVLAAMGMDGTTVQGKGVDGRSAARSAIVPVIELLDEEIDLTPARHVPAATRGLSGLKDSWGRFSEVLRDVKVSGGLLSTIELDVHAGSSSGTTTVGELVRAGALVLSTGQLPPEGSVRTGEVGEGGVPVLSVSDLLMNGDPSGWLPAREVAGAGLVVSSKDDVVVVGVTRAFSAWVEAGAATVLGSQLYSLRADPERLDPWFLAGCLRAPANCRQAGTHTSSSARVDVRKLQVLQLPIEEQRRYGEVFRRVARFERETAELSDLARVLVQELSDGLSAGQLPSAGPVRRSGRVTRAL
ncbi:N-6 DNA methylase [Kitasatospora sp. NPDC096147]|uniref:N-6 DNA methylase n=1 Tax=Kitasatospora sp. NPDC096147 TaxID=3364093 RepID=UPI0038252F42